MDGLDIDDDSETEMSLSKAQQIIRDQADRIRELEVMEDDYRRLQREYDRLKSDIATTQQNQGPYQSDKMLQELRTAKDALRENDRRLQYLEEANNRFVFQMRNLHVQISGKDNEIHELNQEINFIKRKIDKPIEILINEIKQKDLIIEGYKKRQRQNRSTAIRIDDTDNERLSASSFGSMQNSYIVSQQCQWCPGRQRFVRPNRVNVQDETDIINEWNRIVQLFSDQNDPSLIVRLKQYILVNISRLAMLAKDVDVADEGVFSNSCHLCGKRFTCLHRHRVCSYCGFYFCHQCAPHTLPLGSKNEDKPICALCEAMYRLVYKKDE
ncbi:hypothetical protein WA588_002811 [Blastocystis sp. NMH]